MNIAYIVPNLQQTGPIILVQSLVRHLVNIVDKIDVFYIDDCEKPIHMDCQIHKIYYNKPFNFDDYDIIHCHTAKADLYGFLWRWKIKKAKLITTIHQDTFITESYRLGKFWGPIYTRIWLKVQNTLDGIVAISNQIRDTYQKYFNQEITTIYNGVDCEEGIIDSRVSDIIKGFKDKNHIILGTYALITRRKGLNQVIDFLESNPTYKFVVIGDGVAKPELEKSVAEKHLQDRVLFLSHLDKPYLYLQNIDIYVMASYSEGFGLAMVEAALQQKPIVCTDLPSFHEIFPNGEAVFFEPNNINSLKEALNTVSINISKYAELCYNRSKSTFVAQKMADNYLDYYKRLIGKNIQQ